MSVQKTVMHEPPKMGLWIATALVMGNMIGSGIFLLPASLANFGGISLFGWLFTASGAMLLAWTFSQLSRLLPVSGGPYAYTHQAFGDLTGFIVAWGYWIGCWTSVAAMAVSFISYMAVFFPQLSQPLYASVFAIATVWVFTLINMRSVKLVEYLQFGTTFLKILPLLLVIAIGWYFVDMRHFVPFNLSHQSSVSAITSVATLTLWAFIGVEAATVPAGLINNPGRTIPFATLIGTLAVAVIYILSSTTIIGIIPADVLKNSTAPFADAMRPLLGNTGYYFVAACAAISCFGALNGWVLIQGQIAMSAAKDHLFPEVFGELNNEKIPAKGVFISSILVSLLIALNADKGTLALFTFIILVSTLATLTSYVLSSLALVKMLFVQKKRRFLILPILAFFYTLWAIYGSGWKIISYDFLMLLAGLPVYVWQKAKLKKMAKA